MKALGSSLDRGHPAYINAICRGVERATRCTIDWYDTPDTDQATNLAYARLQNLVPPKGIEP